MGKHEREIVQKAEEIVVKIINNEPLTPEEQNHPFIKLNKKFANYLTTKYSNIKKAHHLGNRYDSLGDISLVFDDGRTLYIELKFLKNGFGTLCNISQDSLTKLGIYDCKSWSEFREEKRHFSKVSGILNKFSYPSGMFFGNTKSAIYKKAELLKKVIKAGTQNVEVVSKNIINNKSRFNEEEILAAEIILEIIAFDKQIKIEYLSLLNKSNFDKEKMKLFCFLVLTGTHTLKEIKEEINKDVDLLLEKLKDYKIYYLYKNNLEIKEEENLEKFVDILEDDVGVRIVPNQTNLIIYSKDGDIKKNIIRVVFHWKNKFQGIETPCLNVFVM